jgi:zinc finger protein DZIP1
VGVVAFGDLDAEDPYTLSDTGFRKVFRLAQLVVEYLLYVQDTLQASNAWLQSDRRVSCPFHPSTVHAP